MKRNHRHNMEDYVYLSELRHWNSFCKVIFSLGAVITVIAADSVWVSAFTVLYMGFLSIQTGKVHARDYVRMLSIPFAFLMLSGAAIAIQVGESPVDSVHLPGNIALYMPIAETSLSVTRKGLFLALHVMLKAFGGVSAMYMLTLSTPIAKILVVLHKMHVPSIIVELMQLIYRYIFLLSDLNQKQKDAARSRLGYHNFNAAIRSFSYGLANLLVMSLQRAEACYDAMESRGYDGTFRMLEEENPVTASQIVYLTAYVVLTVAVIGITS